MQVYVSFRVLSNSIDSLGDEIRHMVIDPNSKRLVVNCEDKRCLVVYQVKAPTEVPSGSSLLTRLGYIRGPYGSQPELSLEDVPEEKQSPTSVTMAFAKQFIRGALLCLVCVDHVLECE